MADQHGVVMGEPVVDDRDARAESRNGGPKGDKHKPIKEVRATDIEPYTGLRYLSKLFRFLSVVLILLLIAEVVTGFYTQGSAAIPTLLGEASRLIVLAGVLWGTGDLAHLLIDMGHDVRATRIMAARVSHATKGSAPNTGGSRQRFEVPFVDRPIAREGRVDGDGSGARGGGTGEGPPIP